MAGPIGTGNHPKLHWPGVRIVWGQVYDAWDKEYTDLYEVLSSDMAYEEDVQVTPHTNAVIKPEGQPISFVSDFQGPVTRYTHIPYGLGYIVTHEEIKDNKYPVVAQRRAKANAFAVQQTVETVAAFLYNNALSTTYFTTGDGVALCSTAHVATLGGTYSNALNPAADLFHTSIEDLSIQIMGAQNAAGQQIKVMPLSLHVHRSNYFKALRILESAQASGTANNDVNTLRGYFPRGCKVNHFFTNSGPWFIRTNVPNGMQFFWREEPSFGQDNDWPTKNALAGTYMRFSVGCTDPLGIFGSNGP